MKRDLSSLVRWLTGMTLFAAGAGLCAAPLTWFPGPALGTPLSGAATAMLRSRGNVLIGGDSVYAYASNPQVLAATNAFWTYLPPVYGIGIAPGAVTSGGMIIVYGGSDGTNSTSAVTGYSPAGDTPLNLASMSVARSDLGYTPDGGGNAYAFGGLDGNGQPLSSAERYDQDSGTWAAIAPLPTPLYHFPAVFDGAHYVYIFGGRTNTTAGTEVATAQRYSISANTWAVISPMPMAVAGSAAAMGADGKIYVVGGVSGGVTINVVQVYDPSAGAWVISTPLPEGLSSAAMGVDTLGRLVVMGGMDTAGTDVSDVWRSQQFGVPDSAPGFVSYPGHSAKYQVPYNSSINATGNPQPIYLLLSGPAGMQVDTYSGEVTWTPQADQIGTNSVAIRATNYAGFADWNFTIAVPNPPPAPVTNLTVVGVTDNSVTLSWDPESPAAGAVTYRVYLRHFIHDPRGSGGSVWYTQIGSSVTVPTITISGLTPGLAQVYYVVASGPGGSSGYNAAIAATTTAPQGPPSLWLTGLTSTSVGLAWDPAPGPTQNPAYAPITSYTIMERDMAGSPLVNMPVVTGITGTNGTVTGLKPGSSHLWFVSGADASGNASPLTYVYVVATNPVPVAPQVSGAVRLANGGFQFTVQEKGPVVQTVLVEANTNPADPAGWIQIGSILPDGSVFTFTDASAGQLPARFYRVVLP